MFIRLAYADYFGHLQPHTREAKDPIITYAARTLHILQKGKVERQYCEEVACVFVRRTLNVLDTYNFAQEQRRTRLSRTLHVRCTSCKKEILKDNVGICLACA